MNIASLPVDEQTIRWKAGNTKLKCLLWALGDIAIIFLVLSGAFRIYLFHESLNEVIVGVAGFTLLFLVAHYYQVAKDEKLALRDFMNYQDRPEIFWYMHRSLLGIPWK